MKPTPRVLMAAVALATLTATSSAINIYGYITNAKKSDINRIQIVNLTYGLSYEANVDDTRYGARYYVNGASNLWGVLLARYTEWRVRVYGKNGRYTESNFSVIAACPWWVDVKAPDAQL